MSLAATMRQFLYVALCSCVMLYAVESLTITHIFVLTQAHMNTFAGVMLYSIFTFWTLAVLLIFRPLMTYVFFHTAVHDRLTAMDNEMTFRSASRDIMQVRTDSDHVAFAFMCKALGEDVSECDKPSQTEPVQTEIKQEEPIRSDTPSTTPASPLGKKAGAEE